MTHSWLCWLRAGLARKRRTTTRSTSRSRGSFVPQLLVLEDRTVLSTLTVLNNADSGTGSLRATIAAAQSGDTIVFDPSLANETITLTSGSYPLGLAVGDFDGDGFPDLAVANFDTNTVSILLNDRNGSP